MAYVTIRIKGVEGSSRSDLVRDRMVLGRSSKADLSIKSTSISREHCVFIREGDRWMIEDLGSSNGTWINKDKVVGRVSLPERAIVKAGQARLTFHGVDSMVSKEEAAEDEAAVDLSLEDDESVAAPERKAGALDPPEAIPCEACTAWFSIAHREAGESMSCPRCGHANMVPTISEAE